MPSGGQNSSFLEGFRRVMAPMKRGVKLWENARFILVDVPLNAGAVKRILPFGMWLDSPPTGTLFIVDYRKTSFTIPYKEAALLVHVKTILGKGLHCPWMIVDDDTALIYGREILGYPKKFGKFTFEENGENVSATVFRRDVEVLKMDLKRGKPESPPPPVFDIKTFNVGGPGQLMGIQPIWLFRPKEEIHESYSGEVDLKIGESEVDPISGLVAGGPIRGRFVVMDIVGSRYNLIVGAAGLRWFVNTFTMRYR